MLHNDQDEQRNFAHWLALHQQDEREHKIREMAQQYVERAPGGFNMSNHFNRYSYAWGGGSANYVLPSAPKPAAGPFHTIHLEVDPAITGYSRLIIAENCIREQLDLIDEPCDY
jgi:hypothetical protein